jgi:hypothetical protein
MGPYLKKIAKAKRVGGKTQVVDCLSNKHEALSSNQKRKVQTRLALSWALLFDILLSLATLISSFFLKGQSHCLQKDFSQDLSRCSKFSFRIRCSLMASGLALRKVGSIPKSLKSHWKCGAGETRQKDKFFRLGLGLWISNEANLWRKWGVNSPRPCGLLQQLVWDERHIWGPHGGHWKPGWQGALSAPSTPVQLRCEGCSPRKILCSVLGIEMVAKQNNRCLQWLLFSFVNLVTLCDFLEP